MGLFSAYFEELGLRVIPKKYHLMLVSNFKVESIETKVMENISVYNKSIDEINKDFNKSLFLMNIRSARKNMDELKHTPIYK
ncbi:hypothetical protein JTB14_001359 [Gonioctena quinquepunctata]|nr:hypothetical protein JTB14_001359 [Gonioctena quinquepunctata]